MPPADRLWNSDRLSLERTALTLDDTDSEDGTTPPFPPPRPLPQLRSIVWSACVALFLAFVLTSPAAQGRRGPVGILQR